MFWVETSSKMKVRPNKHTAIGDNLYDFLIFFFFFCLTETRDIILKFLHGARHRYPDLFNQAISNDNRAAEIANLS